MLQLYHGFVRLPPDIMPMHIRSDWGKMLYFMNVRGTINSIHILTNIPNAQQTPYRNRKGTISQNVLAGSTLDMYFFYVCPYWEGAANDTRVLENAEAHNVPHIEGRMWLADAGYGLKSSFLMHTIQFHTISTSKPLRDKACGQRKNSSIYVMFSYGM